MKRKRNCKHAACGYHGSNTVCRSVAMIVAKKVGTETGSAKEFDAFFAVPGSEINDDNEIQKIIEEKTGVRVKETWLTGQTADEAIGTMIAGGEYPDFIEGASGQMQLYDAGALVPLDDYIEKYPNIKKSFHRS